jgi:uncharacterized Zn-finger protein
MLHKNVIDNVDLSLAEPAFRPRCAADDSKPVVVTLSSLLRSLLSAPEVQLLRCALCSFHTSTKAELEKHVVDTHLCVYKALKKCEFCDQKFLAEAQLRVHKQNMHALDWVVFQCEVCAKHFKTMPLLKKHQQRHTNTARIYGCSSCSKAYSTKSSLKLHVDTKHGGRRPVPCECTVCGRVLKSRSNLVLHMKSHGERSLECSVCGWRTKTRHCLRSHMDTHAADKKYLCDTCGTKFFCIGSLRRHKALHEESGIRHCCDICNKTYKTKESLYDHLKVHQGRFDHACDLCDNAYVRKDKLIRHRLKKHNIKEYKCTECPLEFAKLTELKQHHQEEHFNALP